MEQHAHAVKNTSRKPLSFIPFCKDFPEHWLVIKIEVEYLEPSLVDKPEINAIALGSSLASLSVNPSKGIPKYPNPRGINTRQKVYREMIDTLMSEPHLYKEKNQGIKISAFVTSITATERGTSIIALKFAPPSSLTIGQGIHDGQHTLYSFVDARSRGAHLDQARARLLILNGYLPTSSEGNNTVAWQTSYKHDTRTKYNANGRFQPLKEWIPSYWRVGFYQNQPDVPNSPRCSVDHLIQLLSVLDANKYDWLNPKLFRHPIVYARNLGSNYEQACSSACSLAHLVEDAVAIEQTAFECAQANWRRFHQKIPGFSFPEPGSESEFEGLTILPNRKVFQINAVRGFIFPIVSAFRLLLKKDGQLNTLDWAIDFEKYKSSLVKILWCRAKAALLEKAEQGIGQNASGILLSDVEYWHSLCAEAHKFVVAKSK